MNTELLIRLTFTYNHREDKKFIQNKKRSFFYLGDYYLLTLRMKTDL